MTSLQKQRILTMRESGEKYSYIAVELGLSENTVKSFCRRNTNAAESSVCPECGKTLTHIPHKRKKRFCSDKCRLAWWKAHPEALKRKAVYSFVCAFCGSAFKSYGNVKRKYCSRACFGSAFSKARSEK